MCVSTSRPWAFVNAVTAADGTLTATAIESKQVFVSVCCRLRRNFPNYLDLTCNVQDDSSSTVGFPIDAIVTGMPAESATQPLVVSIGRQAGGNLTVCFQANILNIPNAVITTSQLYSIGTPVYITASAQVAVSWRLDTLPVWLTTTAGTVRVIASRGVKTTKIRKSE